MPLLRIELNRHQILNERCLNFIHEMWLVDVAVRMASVDIKALVSVLFFGGGLLWILTSMQSPPTAPNSDSDALKSPSSNSPITESRSSRLCLTSSLKKKKTFNNNWEHLSIKSVLHKFRTEVTWVCVNTLFCALQVS